MGRAAPSCAAEAEWSRRPPAAALGIIAALGLLLGTGMGGGPGREEPMRGAGSRQGAAPACANVPQTLTRRDRGGSGYAYRPVCGSGRCGVFEWCPLENICQRLHRLYDSLEAVREARCTGVYVCENTDIALEIVIAE